MEVVEAITSPWDLTTNTNVTEGFQRSNKLYNAYNILLAVTVAFIMFSMGCGTNFKEIKPILKNPIAPIIGLICQVFLLPLLCFGFAYVFGFDGEMAMGMIIMGTSPGGAVSNVFSFWSRGDLALSVTMTTISTTLALGFVPLNMFIYSRAFVDDGTAIPYLNMFLTVLYTWVAAVLGLLVGWKATKVGFYISKIGSFVGFALIITCGIIQGKLFPEVSSYGWRFRVVTIITPLIGYGIGTALAFAAQLTAVQARTIGFETGMQNAAIALTMIFMSYDEQESGTYAAFPLQYAVYMMIEGVGIVILHRIYFRVKEGRTICQKGIDIKRLETDTDVNLQSLKAPSTSDDSTSKEQPQFNEGVFRSTDYNSTKTYEPGLLTTITTGADDKAPKEMNGVLQTYDNSAIQHM